jgi:hypothetical protein
MVYQYSETETIRLHGLYCFGHVQRMEGNIIPRRVLYMNLETTKPRGRPRNRWKDEVREDGRRAGGEEWQEKVYNIIIIIIIIFYWVVTWWQWSFNTYTKHETGLLLKLPWEGYMISM